MSSSVELHPAPPLGLVLPALAAVGVRIEMGGSDGENARPVTVEEAICLAQSFDETEGREPGSIYLWTDHPSGPNCLHPHYLFGEPGGPALLGLTRYGLNTFPQRVLEAITGAARVYLQYEGADPPPEFVRLYPDHEGGYLFRDPGCGTRPDQFEQGGIFSVPGLDRDSESSRHARQADPLVSDGFEGLEHDGWDETGLWLPDTRSVVPFGSAPLDWQRAEHDAILARLVRGQAADRTASKTRMERFLEDLGFEVPADDVEAERLFYSHLFPGRTAGPHRARLHQITRGIDLSVNNVITRPRE